MRMKSFLLMTLLASFLTSCITTSYYQVYKTSSSTPLIAKDNNLVYEDQNCKVSYNFWGENGNIGFVIFNKTDKNIYLNLEESFFILNGLANNYYRSRTYTKSTNTGAGSAQTVSLSKAVAGLNYLDLLQSNKASASHSYSIMAAEGYAVSYSEEKIVCVPSLTSKEISEYSINETIHRYCDLFLYPTKNQINEKSFTKEDSPLIFSNRVVYTVGKGEKPIMFDNEFYVTEIANYPEATVIESYYEEYCGEKSIS